MNKANSEKKVITLNNKKKCCCLDLFNKKRLVKKSESSLTELNFILSNKKNILQLDSKSFSKTTIHPSQNENTNTSFPKVIISTKNTRKSTITSRMTNQKKDRIIHQTSEKRFFHEFKDKIRCFFCGGKKCKHENYRKNENPKNAIMGLNSNFITPEVIASQRPSEELITSYSLVSKFKQMNIGLIVNLQREGEHPYCGPNAYNLTSAGYSYNPSVFSGDDIRCKLSGWKDMEVPSSMNFMLEIVKDMSTVVLDEKKKVLVHCHAGYGRTGVVIACYLLFNSDKDSQTVINEIRKKRAKCIETKDQRSYCRKFEDFIKNTRILFDNKEKIDVYLKRQEDLLFGNECKKYGFVPKLITKTLEKIYSVKKKYNLENYIIYEIFAGELIEWNEEIETMIFTIKKYLNKNNWELFDAAENLFILVELLFDWFEDSVECVISPDRTLLIMQTEYFVYSNSTTLELKAEKKNDFLGVIRKVYHCFEYEVLYQFASFITLFNPNNKNKHIFNEMVNRMACGLLGYNFFNLKTQPTHFEREITIVKVLSSIINFLYERLNTNELSEKELKVISPARQSTVSFMLKTRISKKVSHFEGFTENPRPNQRKKSSESSFSSSNSSSVKETISKEKKKNEKNEKKLYQIYQLLNNHFKNKSPKNKGDEASMTSSCINSPNEIDREVALKTKRNNKAKSTKNLKKVIENLLDGKSSVSSSGEGNENELKDIVEWDQKEYQIQKDPIPKIAIITDKSNEPQKVNYPEIKPAIGTNNGNSDYNKFILDAKNNLASSIITFESFRKSIFEARTPSDGKIFTPTSFKRLFKKRLPSQMTENESTKRNFNLLTNSSVLEEIKKKSTLQTNQNNKMRKISLCINNNRDGYPKRLSSMFKKITAKNAN